MAMWGLDRLVRWVRPSTPSDAVDAADVGTAFGMELSFEAAEADLQDGKAPRPPDGNRPSQNCTSKLK